MSAWWLPPGAPDPRDTALADSFDAVGALDYLESYEAEPCPGCGDPDCDFDCDGEYDEDLQ